MRVWSDDFGDGEAIPVRHARDGENSAPSFRWAELPEGTRELALLFENLTSASQEPWVHWLIYGIPADAGELPAGIKHRRDPETPGEAVQGTNSLGNVGYDGPQGTVNRVFRYRVRLLALDARLSLSPGLDKQRFSEAATGHILEEACLHAHYQRPA